MHWSKRPGRRWVSTAMRRDLHPGLERRWEKAENSQKAAALGTLWVIAAMLQINNIYIHSHGERERGKRDRNQSHLAERCHAFQHKHAQTNILVSLKYKVPARSENRMWLRHIICVYVCTQLDCLARKVTLSSYFPRISPTLDTSANDPERMFALRRWVRFRDSGGLRPCRGKRFFPNSPERWRASFPGVVCKCVL